MQALSWVRGGVFLQRECANVWEGASKHNNSGKVQDEFIRLLQTSTTVKTSSHIVSRDWTCQEGKSALSSKTATALTCSSPASCTICCLPSCQIQQRPLWTGAYTCTDNKYWPIIDLFHFLFFILLEQWNPMHLISYFLHCKREKILSNVKFKKYTNKQIKTK